MSRLTVGMLKGKSPQGTRSEPKEGTRYRAIYDLFTNNPGKPISNDQLVAAVGWERPLTKSQKRMFGDTIRLCALWYELDIRPYAYGSRWLVGRYINGRYVDYIAPKIGKDLS